MASRSLQGPGTGDRGAPPRRPAQPPVLVILDMNGVLLLRPRGGQTAVMRPYLDTLLATLEELVLEGSLKIAVWSSMMAHNLHPLVTAAFGEGAANLEFVWDQTCCTERVVAGMHKPLLRKDLKWLNQSQWWKHMPDRVLLVDDDPIKCTQNPQGTAIHPRSFTGADNDADDDELLRLSLYLKALVSSSWRSVREFVLSHPFDAFNAEEEDEPPTAKRSSNAFDAQEEDEPPAAKRRRKPVMMKVEAYWPDDDAWLPAKIIKVQKDGSYDVSWDEDGSESTVPATYVRQCGV